MKMDINEVAALFHIHKAASEHADAFKHIRDAAYAALKEINEDHAPKKDEPPAPEPEPEPEELDQNKQEESTDA